MCHVLSIVEVVVCDGAMCTLIHVHMHTCRENHLLHLRSNYCLIIKSLASPLFKTGHRSRCHGNVCLNDFKSERSIPIALHVIINPIDVRGGQSARDDKSRTRTLRAECVTINPVHVRCGQSA